MVIQGPGAKGQSDLFEIIDAIDFTNMVPLQRRQDEAREDQETRKYDQQFGQRESHHGFLVFMLFHFGSEGCFYRVFSMANASNPLARNA